MVREAGDSGDIYNGFLDVEEVTVADMKQGDVVIKRGDKIVRPKASALWSVPGSAKAGEDRCVFDCIRSP